MMKGIESTVADAHLMGLKRIQTAVGDLVVMEKGQGIEFSPVRVYYLYDVPDSSERGEHAHRELQQVIVAISGSFKVVLSDGRSEREFLLRKPSQGLVLPPGLWRSLTDFSGGAICLVLASQEYAEEDYIRDWEEYQSWKVFS